MNDPIVPQQSFKREMLELNVMDHSIIVEGLFYQTGMPVRIHISKGLIGQIEPLPEEGLDVDRRGSLPFIGPGFVDLQINGFSGIDFNTAYLMEEDVHIVTRKLWGEGTTSYYPTVITNSNDEIETIVRIIAHACNSDSLTAQTIAGIHLEGPFISPIDGPRGAHDKRFVKAPDWPLFERWQKAADGLIRIVTLSPEWDEAPKFIEKCVNSGVVVSIGHTAATPEQIHRAVQSGATMSTHLGNGAHLTLPRHPNYLWEQLAHDQLSACVIADGFHLPESVLKVIYKVKQEKLILVSDAVHISGLPPGEYVTHIGGRVVLSEEGRLFLANQPGILAGSASMLKIGIAHMVKSNICSLASAWDMASTRPASFMQLAVGGGLSKGKPADLITLDWEANDKLAIREVYKNGKSSDPLY